MDAPGGRLRDRVAIVTGAGGGLGRAHALALAAAGASVVVNDYGVSVTGDGAHSTCAHRVVQEIEAAGGRAIANAADVGDWAQAEGLVAQAVQAFGRLDILVNNAGILRPRTLVGLARDDVEAVLRVHLIGTFATTHFAAAHWREGAKRFGKRAGRLINTTSASGLFGLGQANYAAAKAGVAALTAIAAEELGRYGVTANAIAPMAMTRMSEGITPPEFSPDHAASLVCWLASDAAAAVSGYIFSVGGGHIGVVERSHTGPSLNKRGIWQPDELDAQLPALLASAAPRPDLMGYRDGDPRPEGLPPLELPRGDSP
jgi:NAD(P)-dependent dehydrogenase (short-subunit alcohol dehydrogenase family)